MWFGQASRRRTMSADTAIYLRESTRKQTSESQLEEAHRLAEQRGWTVSEYHDQGSGKSGGKLPNRARMMEDARRGRIRRVIVYKLDRLARSLRELVNILDNLRIWGVDLVVVTQGFDTTTSVGRMALGMVCVIAEFERDLIQERVMSGLAAARLRGVVLGRPRVQVDLAKANRLQAEGLSLSQCAKRLGVSRRTLATRLKQAGGKPLDNAGPEPRMDAGPGIAPATAGETK